jgi:hypothetical protein
MRPAPVTPIPHMLITHSQEGDGHMPQWLFNQLMRAFQSKNRRQIRILNDSWFFYRTHRIEGKLSGTHPNEPFNKQH